MADPEPPARPSGARVRAVVFDAGNTLIYMPRTAEEILLDLCSQLGLSISPEDAREAYLESERYYTENYLGYDGDQRGFWHRYHGAALRSLGADDPDGAKAAFLSHGFGLASVWQSYPDAAATCERLRSMGLRLGVASNGPVNVPEMLRNAGLLDFFKVVVTSQGEGVEKPDPRIFQAALRGLDVAAEEALFVGDLYDVDVLGARAVGLKAALIDREGAAPADLDCPILRSLEDVVPLVTGSGPKQDSQDGQD